jgi:hypothetical protein
MNDRRVAEIRGALEDLVESMDATTRIARWGNSDPIPDSLRTSAAKLEASLQFAHGLALASYAGTPAVTLRLLGTSAAIRRLIGAYVDFQAAKGTGAEADVHALEMLDAAIDSARAEMRELE